jgi:phage-related protein
MQLDDTVHVYVPTLDVDVKAKVIAVRYNVLLDRVDSVEIGNFKTTLADAIRAL